MDDADILPDNDKEEIILPEIKALHEMTNSRNKMRIDNL